MCEYNPVVRSFQGRGDLRLLRWIQTVPIYNNWTVIEHSLRNLRSSSCIGKEGRGRETCLANVSFGSKKMEALRGTCHEKDLYFGFSSRRSCRSSSEWKSDLNDSGLLKTFVRRCHRAPSSWYGPLEVMTDAVPWNVVAMTSACQALVLSGSWWNQMAPTFGGWQIMPCKSSLSSSTS